MICCAGVDCSPTAPQAKNPRGSNRQNPRNIAVLVPPAGFEPATSGLGASGPIGWPACRIARRGAGVTIIYPRPRTAIRPYLLPYLLPGLDKDGGCTYTVPCAKRDTQAHDALDRRSLDSSYAASRYLRPIPYCYLRIGHTRVCQESGRDRLGRRQRPTPNTLIETAKAVRG